MVLSWAFGLSRRWELALMLCSGVIIVYTLRVNMSVAAPKMRDDLGWSDSQKGLVLSSFYWGYAAGQIPASYIAQYYGSKHLFGLSILIPSILTLFVPLACNSSFQLALIVRMLIGFFESASFPAIFHFLPHWVPVSEKTVILPVIYSGMYIGEIIAFSLSGILVESHIVINDTFLGSWPSVFYAFGLVGVLWYPFWVFTVYERPEDHPGISDDEKEFILTGKDYKRLRSADHSDTLVEGALYGEADESHSEPQISTHLLKINREFQSVDDINASNDASTSVTPWLLFFSTPASLTLLLASWVHGWVGFLLLSEMPSYFSDELGFDLSTSGVLCVAPYAGMLVATLAFSAMFKHLQTYSGWKTRSVRQCAQFIAFLGSTLTLVVAGYLSSSPYAAFALVIISQSCLGASNSGLACCYLDLAPNFSGQYATVGNTIGAVAGILGPIIVALFTETWSGEVGWRATFFLTAAMALAALVCWYCFQSSEINRKLNTSAR